MTDLKLPLVIVAVGAALAFADFSPADPVVAQTDPDRVTSLRDLLTEQHEIVVARLDDHTNRLIELQTITQSEPEIVNDPPEEPVALLQAATLPEGWSIRKWTATWCGVCKTDADRHEGKFAPDEVIEIDFDENEDEGRRLGIKTLPTYEIQKDGKTVIRIVGPRTAEQLQQSVQRQTTTSKAVFSPASQPVRRGPVIVRDQWGSYRSDSRFHCGRSNCAMCNSRRANRERWQSSTIKLGQEPAPEEQIDEAIKGLGLGPDSVLADIGCGDARVLVRAAYTTGCSGVGIEIDAERAAEARRNVESHGLADRIRIVTADARTVDLSEFGTTHCYTFLFGDLLGQLRETLEQYPVAAVYHPIPGRTGTLKNGVYFYV